MYIPIYVRPPAGLPCGRPGRRPAAAARGRGAARAQRVRVIVIVKIIIVIN